MTASAQSPADLATMTLEELLDLRVVTVTRTSATAAGAPGVVEVVTARQIQQRGYRSIADLLRDLPAVKVDFAIDQDLSNDVTIQGSRGSSRLVILLDGIRITSPTGEPMPLLANIPVHHARQVEFVYGPASALYGADAFSGVINIITRSASEAGGLRAAAEVAAGVLSNTTVSYGVTAGDVKLTAAAQVFSDGQPGLSDAYPDLFGDLRSHRTGTFHTIFGPMTAAVPVSPEYDLPVKAHNLHAVAEFGRLRGAVFHSRVKTSNTPAYTPENAVYNDLAFADNRLWVGSIQYAAPLAGADTLTTVSAARHELAPSSGYLNVFSNMQRSYKYAYGSVLRAEHQATWQAAAPLRLTAGGAYDHAFSIPQSADLAAPVSDRGRAGTLLGTTILDERYATRFSNVGGFLQGEWSLSRTATLTTGLRTDYNSRSGGVVNPRVGLVSSLGRATTIKFLYGQAYLAPSPYQSFAHFGSFYSVDGGDTYQSDFWHVPNPDLRPQYKRTAEGQLLHKLTPNVSVSAGAFYSRFSDLVLESDITSRQSGQYRGWPVGMVQQSVNGGRETMFGGTFTADYLHGFGFNRQVRLRGSLSLAEGSVDHHGAPGGRLESGGFAPVVAQVVGDFQGRAWSVSSRLGVVGRQRALAFDEFPNGPWQRRTIDGHATVDLTVRRARVARRIDLFAKAENVFDMRHRHLNLRAFTNPEEFIGSPQNPRRVAVGMQIALGGRD